MYPKLILTRPEADSQHVLTHVQSMHQGRVCGIISPVLRMEAVASWDDNLEGRVVILTSKNAVLGPLNGVRAHCVGQQTAAAAEANGAEIVSVYATLRALVAAEGENLTEALYLRGAHVTCDLARTVGCEERVVYHQHEVPLTDLAKAAIAGEMSAILPLYSSRSARLISGQVSGLGRGLVVVAMSKSVADAWCAAFSARNMSVSSVEISPSPDGEAMLGGIVAAISRMVT